MANKYKQAIALYNQGNYEEAFDLLYGETDRESLQLKATCKNSIKDQYVYLIKSTLDQKEYAKARHLRETYLSKFGQDSTINAFQIPNEMLSSILKEEIPSVILEPQGNISSLPKKRNSVFLLAFVCCIIIGYILLCIYQRTNNQERSNRETSSVNIEHAKEDILVKNSLDAGYYEGEMAGFPMSLYIIADGENNLSGQYRNIKYGTVLSLSGNIEPTGDLKIEAGNNSETIYFTLSYSNGSLEGYGSNKLNVHLTKRGTPFTDEDWFQLKYLANQWNDRHTLKEGDLAELESLYADQCFFYGQTLSAEKCVLLIKQIIEKYDTYNQKLVGDLTFIVWSEKMVKCAFVKRVMVNGTSRDYEAYLIFEKKEDHWFIHTESDKATDVYFERLRKKKK